MTVSKRIRFEVLRRDSFTCRYCHATDKPLQIDHVIPVALGGTDTADNLVAACADCNNGKTSVRPDEETVDDVSAKAMLFGKALHKALAGKAKDIKAEKRYTNKTLSDWEDATSITEDKCLPLPHSWESTFRYWHSLGVPHSITKYAFAVAMDRYTSRRLSARDAFAYAKGIVKNKIRESYDEASREVPDGA